MPNQLPKIALGWIRSHQVAAGFMESMIATLLYDRETWNLIEGRIVPCFCAPYLNLGRNQVVATYCDRFAAQAPVFVFLDTDHAWLPTDLMRIVAAVDRVERPVVGALYVAPDREGRQIRPIVLRRDGHGRLYTVWDYPKDTLVEVDVLGMGFTAIHGSLLLEMRERNGDHWFDFDENESGDFQPEDNAFCRRVQDFLNGRIYVHTGICVTHYKTVALTAEDIRRGRPAAPKSAII